jgi:ABC-2 type transport system permease protein
MAVFWVWLPVFLVSTMICESFAGERERKTLETLLASRLDDRTILFGKIAAAVGYGWGLALTCVGLGFITVNAVHAHGTPILLPAETVFAVVSISLLASGLIASAGVLMSLRSPTVRQAQQTMSLSLLVLFFGATFGLNSLPAAWKGSLLRTLAGGNVVATIIIVCVGLLGVYALLIRSVSLALQLADFGIFYCSLQAFAQGRDMYGPCTANVVTLGRVTAEGARNLNPTHAHLLWLPLWPVSSSSLRQIRLSSLLPVVTTVLGLALGRVP